MKSGKHKQTISKVEANQVIGNDSIDAKKFFAKIINTNLPDPSNQHPSHPAQLDPSLPSTSNTKPVSIPTSSKYYDTSHANRGVAIIFNHFQFSNMDLSPRNRTNKDRDDIANVLKKFNFDVRIHNNLKRAQIMDVLSSVARENHKINDCIVIVVMTYSHNGNLYANDALYAVSELFNNFVGSNCELLIGKPKLVFIQAGREQKLDVGLKYTKTKNDCVDSLAEQDKVTYFIPQMADLLVMFSTFEEHDSWRNPTDGSWFIQSLCAELLQNGHSDTLLTILTGVLRRVLYEYQLKIPKEMLKDCLKQMPCITSMLTKNFVFHNKN